MGSGAEQRGPLVSGWQERGEEEGEGWQDLGPMRLEDRVVRSV